MEPGDATSPADILAQVVALEEERKKLAAAGLLGELAKLYGPDLPHLPAMNTPDKWDFFSHQGMGVPRKHTRMRIRKVAGLIPRDAKVLDFGCGYCFILREGLRRNLAWDYVGVDFSPRFIDRQRRTYPQFTFYCGDLSAVPRGDFDYVLLLEVLEHVLPSQTQEFLLSFKPYLKSTGKVLLTVPLFEDLRATTSPCWACGKLGNLNGHVRSYTPQLIAAEMKLAGMSVHKLIPVYWPFPFLGQVSIRVRGRRRFLYRPGHVNLIVEGAFLP